MSGIKKNIDRRDFLKFLGGAAALTTLSSCSSGGESTSEKSGKSSGKKSLNGKIEMRESANGDQVGLLGYGCMRWPLLDTPAADGNVIDQEAVNDLVDYALEHGVNYFDTAPVYLQGWSEYTMGVALSRHPRESYRIATKISNFNASTWSKEGSIAMYKNSFEKLKVDYVDYLLLHSVGGGNWERFKTRYIDNGILDFAIEEREAGRVRNIGFSFHGDVTVFDYLLSRHDEIKWDFVQIQLNYVDWKYADPTRNINAEYLYTELEKRGIAVVVMEPLLGGRLATLPEHLSKRLLAERPDESIASWAFRYAATHKNVLTVLSGMTYLEHLQDNIGTYSDFEPITEEENKLLMDTAKMLMEYPMISCTACQYCMPCPYGIDIPKTFSHYNKCINEGNYPLSTQDENYAAQRRAFLIGYDRSVPKLRQADHCIGCKKCVDHCPQSIDIPSEMKRVNKYVESLKQNKF
ncbi:MAG: aldo/keto reductase [Rikenellaceae bacterium]